MSTKLRIDLNQGTLEVEGSEEFVTKIYNDYREKLSDMFAIQDPPAKPSSKKAKPSVKPKTSSANKGPTKKSIAGTKKASGSEGALLKDLDLSGKSGNTNLRDYCSQFVIKSNMERNLVFTYYLQNELEIEGIGIDHIFTCYRFIPKTKLPGNLKQSLYDTSSKGWLAIKTIDDGISVPVAGINHIEHDLPKPNESS